MFAYLEKIIVSYYKWFFFGVQDGTEKCVATLPGSCPAAIFRRKNQLKSDTQRSRRSSVPRVDAVFGAYFVVKLIDNKVSQFGT